MTSDGRHLIAVTASGAGIPAAMRRRVSRATGFRGGPRVAACLAWESVHDSPRHAPAPDDGARGRSPGAVLVFALARGFSRLVPACWVIPGRSNASIETIVASLGSVEIRCIPAGCMAQTCVKGDPAQARETALRRLTRYARGDNLGGIKLAIARPVVQQQVAPGRWRVSARLASIDAAATAPMARSPKVKVISSGAELLAVVRMRGHPRHDRVAGGDSVILTAIANTEWIATGAPTIRLHKRGPWFGRGFEVAVPVSARSG